MLQRGKKALVVVCLVFMALGCGPKRLTEMKVQDPAQCLDAVEGQGLRLCVKPIFDGGECESYYGINIVKKGYLPVEVSIANHSSDSIDIPGDAFSLTYHGNDLKPTPADDVYKYLKASVGGRTAGWGVLCGVIGGVAAYNSAKHRNEALGTSLHRNKFDGQVLEANKDLQGVLYFRLPKGEAHDRTKEQGLTFHLDAKHGSESDIKIDVPLKEPKE